MVRASSRHLLELINDVLDISKIEAGELEIHRAPFDIGKSVLKVAELMAPAAHAKGLTLKVISNVPSIEILSDQRRVEQVVLNLVSNAVKFTEVGGVTIDVAADAEVIRVRVSDTGVGIKTENLSALFQPFRQIESGITRPYEGTGLGLAICRRLSDLLGAKITVESEWGRGSVFALSLPTRARARMSAKVLLIEDNEQNRYLATFLLEKHGFTVVSAPDGVRGIELAQSVSPQIILLDIQLPKLDGYQIARSLRTHEQLRSVPIVAVTSYAMPGDRERALEAGCDGYIEKPINPDTFADQVKSFLPSGPTSGPPT